MEIEAKLAELEERIAKLEQQSPPTYEGGIVSFQGDVTVGSRQYSYKWARPTQFLTDEIFHSAMERVSALAHPIRHALLRRLLDAPAPVTELVAEGLASSGAAYHHLTALQAAGWVRKRDNLFEIPPARVVPLLTIIAASEDHR
ncbi:winged helix-turn-helix transcriptional regulator [Corynebacterium hindlerae]|uniref:ArsR/SmtB family transcription factor n=1 Tax=Corynebacterium hindlerae TaxID=699041 RepID=UPI001AD696B5|nr:winged helix-turn-helix domain-containing protein [Corynebacterium hindlerae]QTH58992.1 winged helix-turn-helix transcriptional regulator [Corynebacterium hindlerae]